MSRTRSTYLHQLSDLLPSEKVKKVHTSVAPEKFCHSSSSSCMVWQKFSNLEKKEDSRFFLQKRLLEVYSMFFFRLDKLLPKGDVRTSDCLWEASSKL